MSDELFKLDKKSLVPDFAIVPRLFIKSFFVIPIPVSKNVNVLFSLFGMIFIYISLPVFSCSCSVILKYLILLIASDELLINSLTKISLFL